MNIKSIFGLGFIAGLAAIALFLGALVIIALVRINVTNDRLVASGSIAFVTLVGLPFYDTSRFKYCRTASGAAFADSIWAGVIAFVVVSQLCNVVGVHLLVSVLLISWATFGTQWLVCNKHNVVKSRISSLFT